MIRKTDKFQKRFVTIWSRGVADRGNTAEIFRRETWWLFWVIPLYSKETIIDKPR